MADRNLAPLPASSHHRWARDRRIEEHSARPRLMVVFSDNTKRERDSALLDKHRQRDQAELGGPLEENHTHADCGDQ